jgi:uncharacterized phage protein (TIGR01671 family)
MKQREIKFRVWDNVDAMWGPYTLYDMQPPRSVEFTKDCPVMQYTGLKDKDGREIYEGDVIDLDSYPFYSGSLRNYLGEVYWCARDHQWSVGLHVVSDRVSGSATGRALCEDDGEGWKVVGNIYETPELLTHDHPPTGRRRHR